MAGLESLEPREKLTLDIDVQGLPEFLDAFSQMEAAIDKICDKLERMKAISRLLCKTFNITNNYHLTCFKEPDKED